MKFQRLDIHDKEEHAHIKITTNDVYQYLDDLLDKTFLTDYFLDRSSDATAAATAAATAGTTP
jgi:hypothetical protein